MIDSENRFGSSSYGIVETEKTTVNLGLDGKDLVERRADRNLGIKID